MEGGVRIALRYLEEVLASSGGRFAVGDSLSLAGHRAGGVGVVPGDDGDGAGDAAGEREDGGVAGACEDGARRGVRGVRGGSDGVAEASCWRPRKPGQHHFSQVKLNLSHRWLDITSGTGCWSCW